MKKRLSLCLLSLLALLSLAVPARADVLIEPENSFYTRHRDECSVHQRSYYANGTDGFVTLWDAPGGTGVAAQYENGETLYVYYLYQDWGCVFLDGDSSGWVAMDQLEVIYDYISFQEEYGDRFRDYDGEFAGYDGSADGIVFWPYPGAAEPELIWTYGGDILSNLTGRESSAISKVFVDEAGLVWGYVGYLYGNRNFWICLDDPTRAEFSVRDTHQAELIAARTPVLPPVSYTPYILVGGVVLVTAGLLVLFYRKKGPKEPADESGAGM